MKYYYLFVLITGIAAQVPAGESELNKDQERQIDCLVIQSGQKENAITNKLGKLCLPGAYQIETIVNDEVMPMAVSDQFVIPVLKYGIPGKEPEYTDDYESLS